MKLNVSKHILPIVFTLLLIHASIHIVIYKSSLSSKVEISKYNLEKPSAYAIIAEAVLIMILTVLKIIKRKKQVITPKKISLLEVKAEEKKSGIHTDIDILYKMLKEKKNISISEIAKAFNINKELALEWCKTLETAELAEIQYSTLKEEVLTLKENEKEKEQ